MRVMLTDLGNNNYPSFLLLGLVGLHSIIVVLVVPTKIVALVQCSKVKGLVSSNCMAPLTLFLTILII